jgi:hypothetical protein
MAIRGRKPKSARLHVLKGTFRHDRHHFGDESLGPIEKPRGLQGRPGKLWDQIIARASWLTWADGPKALMWCHLQAEFEEAPADMVAARIAQTRALASELGLDPASRARSGWELPGAPDPAEKFFR